MASFKCPKCQATTKRIMTTQGVMIIGPEIQEGRPSKRHPGAFRRRYYCSCGYKFKTFEATENHPLNTHRIRPPEYYKILAEYNAKSA